MMRSARSNTAASKSPVGLNRTKAALRGSSNNNKSLSRGGKQEKDSSDNDNNLPQQMRKSTRNRGGATQESPVTTVKKSNNISKHQIIDETLYAKGSYVAFIDASDSLEKFKIAHLIDNIREIDDEVVVDIYAESQQLTFTRSVVKVPIFEYAIICDINVEQVPTKKGGKGAKPQPSVKINRQQFNKVTSQMENTIRRIEEEKKSEQDSQSESESEKEEEEEPEESEAPGSLKKDSKATIKGRKIVKGPRTSVTAGKPQKAPAVSVREAKIAAKKASKKVPAKESSDEEAELEMTPTEMNDASQEIEMINTQSKRSGGSKPATKKHTASVPKVGQKRMRKSSKKDEDDEEGEPSEFMEDEDAEGGSSQPVKKRKVASGKAKIEKPAKKAPKKPTEFKKGKWNPDVELANMDKYKEHAQNELFIECCIRCNNRNIIRAAITGNQRLMKAGIDAKTKISQLTAFWSPEVRKTPVDYLIKSNNHELLEILMHPKVHIPQYSNYENERSIFYNERVHNPQYLMNFIDSGVVSHMAYGTSVREVEMTRGNRQGKNAFLQYDDNYQRNPVAFVTDESTLRNILYSDAVNYETIKSIYKLNPEIENFLQSYVYEAVRAGNRRIAYESVKNMAQHTNFGFNQLHADVLSDDAVLSKVLRQSVTKKANTNRDLTPLHCACINPNPKYLKALLGTGADIQTIDTDLRRPVHYAAACVGPEPLKVLIAAGANLADQDNQKRNCLHLAAMTGRAENIIVILQTSPNLVSLRDKKSMTPIAYACKYGKIEAVKALLELKAKLNVGVGAARMTPLMWASAYGHLDLVEILLEAKGRVLGKDRFKRTALTMAVRNGHTKIASILLQNGSEWDHPDSSMNTPLHYAAAYGWLDCIELLLKTGADVNAQNSWKISPINIAMLKNHHGCVKRFLEEPNVDVDGKDDKGRTLIMLSLCVLDDESFDFVSFLLKKGADPNIADLQGMTSLHYLAQYQPRSVDENNKPSKIILKRQIEIQKKLVQLLIANKADLSLKDKMDHKAFTVCLKNGNASLLEFLKDKVSLNKEPELLFAFKDKIFNVEYQHILEQLMKNDPPTKETMNCLDAHGRTPFLAYVQSFTKNYDPILETISNKINQQSFIHGNNRRMYQLTNADVFDKYADQSNYYNYNQTFSEEEKMEMSRDFFDKIIAKPFITIMKHIIEQGADVHAQVQKLKKYREIDEKKRLQLLQLNEGENAVVMPAAQTNEQKEKKQRREEKVQEMRQSKQMYVRRLRCGGNPGMFNFNQWNEDDEDEPDDSGDQFDKVNGEKVLREYGPYGLRNALHFIIAQPQKSMFDFLVSLKINGDLPDYDEVTPFNLMSSTVAFNNLDATHQHMLKSFLSMDVRVDYPNRKGRTAFLNFYEKSNFEMSYQMLDLGANVNQMDMSGLFALKYAMIRRQNPSIQKLLDRGAKINQVDNKGRNLLHHAINMSSATADATFETEQFLINRGVNINLKDKKLRTPLHYAFLKIQDCRNSTQIDPIETVSSLCSCKGLEIDISDKWQKTPLHYASQRGASICAMYLLQHGAQLESKDIYGNTALGVGLMYSHYNYGIILIQKGASVKPLIFKEEPERIKKMWGDLEKAKNKKPNEEIKEEMQFAQHKPKKHQNLFTKPVSEDDHYGDEYGEEVDEDEGDSDDDKIYQENVFNQQNAFGMQVFAKPARMTPAYYGRSQFGQNLGVPAKNSATAALALTTALITDKDKKGVSMFKLSIRGCQQGLAYLMIDNGYDLMLAMQDAMDENKFMLVLTLLCKTPDDSVIQSKNKKGQNLFHILSQNAARCNIDHLQRIYRTLQKRGVDCKAKDNFGRTALHYAVISTSLQLVKMLVTQTEGGYDPNGVDNFGHTPLSLLMKGENNTQHAFYNPKFKQESIFYLLCKAGADVNVVYPEPHYKPALKEEDLDEDQFGEYDPNGQYLCTPLINLLKLNPQGETMRNNLIGLLEFGARLDITDSDGRDPLMHAIIKNNEMVLKMLLQNKNTLGVNCQGQDKSGKSAVHFVVNPIRFGSYENVDILNLLNKHKFDLQLKDSHGSTPAHYASQQESGIMFQELTRLTHQEDKLQMINRQLSMIKSQNWPESKVDYEVDAEMYMELAGEREKALAKEKNQKIPVDKIGRFEVQYEVYYDESEKPWDVYLTKVDLKNGIYGDYVFYKMQLLYDTNRDLYVVFTRWGRIGETGMNQRTPFNKLDKAKDDFKKIFKQKTGGNNFEELDKFSRVKKKYNLTRVNYITVNMKDYLQPFDYKKAPKSRLPQSIYDLFQEISNITMYQKVFNQYGIDTDVFPFSGLNKQSLVEARQVLNDIQDCIKEDIEISKEGIKADFDKLTAVKEKISELSSRFYELVPQKQYKDQIAPPLSHQHMIKQQYDMLESLTNIEQASKVLLGALLRQKEMNPIDYVYQAMNLMIESLDQEGPEYEAIRTYIDNTRNDQHNYDREQYEIANIYKVQRKGEAEMIQTFKEVPNHYLLFHGSMMFNFIGILSSGLKIAPPEAPATGYMFGKGVYFADMFDKSFQYAARGLGQQESYLMLMCEVVLGKQKEFTQANFVEKLEHPFHSVKGCGRRGPGYKHTITLPNAVKIPYGKVIDYAEVNIDKQIKMVLQHNEYIVYNTSQIRMRYVVKIQKKNPSKQAK